MTTPLCEQPNLRAARNFMLPDPIAHGRAAPCPKRETGRCFPLVTQEKRLLPLSEDQPGLFVRKERPWRAKRPEKPRAARLHVLLSKRPQVQTLPIRAAGVPFQKRPRSHFGEATSSSVQRFRPRQFCFSGPGHRKELINHSLHFTFLLLVRLLRSCLMFR